MTLRQRSGSVLVPITTTVYEAGGGWPREIEEIGVRRMWVGEAWEILPGKARVLFLRLTFPGGQEVQVYPLRQIPGSDVHLGTLTHIRRGNRAWDWAWGIKVSRCTISNVGGSEAARSRNRTIF